MATITIRALSNKSDCAFVQTIIHPSATNEVLRWALFPVNAGTLAHGLEVAQFGEVATGRYTIIVQLMDREMQVIAYKPEQFDISSDNTHTIEINTPPFEQKGENLVSISGIRKAQFNLRFPVGFGSDNVKVLVTPRSVDDSEFVFSASVRKITKFGCTVDIYRVDGPEDTSGWLQQLRLAWYAWEVNTNQIH